MRWPRSGAEFGCRRVTSRPSGADREDVDERGHSLPHLKRARDTKEWLERAKLVVAAARDPREKTSSIASSTSTRAGSGRRGRRHREILLLAAEGPHSGQLKRQHISPKQGQLYRLRSERASHHARLNDRTHSVEEIIFRRPMIPSLRRSGIRQKKATTDIALDCYTAAILRCASQRDRTHSQLTKPRSDSFDFPHNLLIDRCAMMAEHDFLQVTPPWRRRT
jgi:hypothetical protein